MLAKYVLIHLCLGHPLIRGIDSYNYSTHNQGGSYLSSFLRHPDLSLRLVRPSCKHLTSFPACLLIEAIEVSTGSCSYLWLLGKEAHGNPGSIVGDLVGGINRKSERGPLLPYSDFDDSARLSRLNWIQVCFPAICPNHFVVFVVGDRG